MSLGIDVPAASWHHPNLELRPSAIHGLGVFTSKPIPQGESVIVWGGQLFTAEDIMAGKGKAHTVVQIDDHLFLGAFEGDEKTLDDYMNHSCDPTIWLRDAITLETCRYIRTDEELTADYAIWLNDTHYRLRCNCGAICCRGMVSGTDWMLSDLQARYRNHFAPFLNNMIGRLL